MADESTPQTPHTDNMAADQPEDRGQESTPPAPVFPDPDAPAMPEGTTPPSGQAESPQDIIREEGEDRASRDDERT